jgi:hypothetical protein
LYLILEFDQSLVGPSSDEYFLGSSPAYSLSFASLLHPSKKAVDPSIAGDALASYAVAASGFLLPFAKASKRKFSVNIDEKLAPICCVGTQEIKNNMKLDATRLCKCNIQCIVVN